MTVSGDDKPTYHILQLGGATYNRDRDIMGIKPCMYTTRINDNWVRLNMKD